MPNNMVMSSGLNAPPEGALQKASEVAALHLGHGVVDISFRVDYTETCLFVYTVSVAACETPFPPNGKMGELVARQFFLPSVQQGELFALFSLDGSCWVKEGREHCLAVLLPAVVLASLLYKSTYRVTWRRRVPNACLANDGSVKESDKKDYVETVRYAVSAGSVTCEM